MDCFIKKIFDDNIDSFVHLQFQKFGKGEFKDRAMIKATHSKGNFSINTTPEYANELVRSLAEKLGSEKTKVSGVIVSTRDLDLEEIEFKDKKQFMGVKKYVIEKELSGDEILAICDKFPASFIAFSFSTKDTTLKIKPKPPRSAKPNIKEGDKPKINFCSLKTTDKSLVNSLIFDKEAENFKNLEIKHTFLIKEIIMPSEEELGEEKNNFAKIRELSKRKGKIIRELDIDGKKLIKEKEFVA